MLKNFWQRKLNPKLWTILILCTFGFFREVKPNEPYVTEYLSGRWWNLSQEVLNQKLFPLGTYFYLFQLIIVFLVTDMVRYKPVIILSAACGVGVIICLVWGNSWVHLYIMQFCYGTFAAAEVAYSTYIYAKVDKVDYEKVTGQVRSAILLGKFSAATIAQLVILYDLLNYLQLHYISFSTQIISIILAICLPKVGTSLYFYADSKEKEAVKEQPIKELESQSKGDQEKENCEKQVSKEATGSGKTFSISNAVTLIKEHLIAAYTDRVVICWSAWWALAFAGYMLVFVYIQLLWKSITHESVYNGAAEALQTLCSAIGAYSAGLVNSDRAKKRVYLVLTSCSMIQGSLLLWGGLTSNIWSAYIAYVLFATLYNFVLTLSNAVVAKRLPEESFALIFGINTFFALCIQTIMTLVFISRTEIVSTPGEQFQVFGFFFLTVAAIYGLLGIMSTIRSMRGKTYTLKT